MWRSCQWVNESGLHCYIARTPRQEGKLVFQCGHLKVKKNPARYENVFSDSDGDKTVRLLTARKGQSHASCCSDKGGKSAREMSPDEVERKKKNQNLQVTELLNHTHSLLPR